MKHCPHYRGVMRRDKDGRREVLSARCKSWSCPYCAPINAKKLRHSITDSIRQLRPTMALFATLTASGGDRSSQATYDAIRLAWPKIRQWILRHYGPCEYALIYERHKSGAYHAHIVLIWLYTPYWPKLSRRIKRDLKDNGPRWGIGRQADAQMIRDGVDGVVKYVAKAVVNYMGKDSTSTKDGLKRGARLYYLSAGIKAVFSDDIGAGGWAIGSPVTLDEVLTVEVYSLQESRLLNSDDFTDSDTWPQVQVDNVDF